MPHSETVKLAKNLISRKSVTPEDGGCQKMLTERLMAIGFKCEQMDFEDVKNLWAVRGSEKPLMVFAGHTDVVPAGPLDQWDNPPFDGKIENGILYGRGAADMKGSIACFTTACERFIANNPDHRGSIGLLITSDEEGVATWGTRAVMDELAKTDTQIDMCIVGEPTCVDQFGDTVKVGRRGSLNAKLLIRGIQGHIAYPYLADNPIHLAISVLKNLIEYEWDQGNENFPPTSFQISNIHSGTGATNVIPGDIEINFNFRYSPETSDTELKKIVTDILEKNGVEFRIKWGHPSYPFETKKGKLIEAVVCSIQEVTGINAEQSTTGGTSDGRFIAPAGAQVVELGPINATIHKINEQVTVKELDQLSQCYEKILEKLLV